MPGNFLRFDKFFEIFCLSVNLFETHYFRFRHGSWPANLQSVTAKNPKTLQNVPKLSSCFAFKYVQNIRKRELICSKGIQAFYQTHNQNTRKTTFQASLELTRGCLIWTKCYIFQHLLSSAMKYQMNDFSTTMITVNTV